jgi:hypothetical protein
VIVAEFGYLTFYGTVKSECPYFFRKKAMRSVYFGKSRKINGCVRVFRGSNFLLYPWEERAGQCFAYTDFQIIFLGRQQGGDSTGSTSPTDNEPKIIIRKSIVNL